MALNQTRLDQDNDTLKEILKANIDKSIEMCVYSSKTQMVRSVQITPNATWGGQGLLGVSIRFCSFQNAAENVWRILDVSQNFIGLLLFLIRHILHCKYVLLR